MDKFATESTSRYSQKVLEPIIIYQKDRTRCIFRAEMNDAIRNINDMTNLLLLTKIRAQVD